MAALMMLKAPRPGFVKTRLARDIGAEAACAAFRVMAERQVERVPAGWKTIVHFAPADARLEMERWLGEDVMYVPQVEGDLGARMAAAVQAAWAQGLERAVLLGGDCPAITTELLERVERELGTHDLVIGPAVDGGYYLLGLNAPMAGPFTGVTWSTDQVLTQTLAQAEAHGWRVARLPELEDVDDVASWERAQALVMKGA